MKAIEIQRNLFLLGIRLGTFLGKSDPSGPNGSRVTDRKS